jgi:hypothetical protein
MFTTRSDKSGQKENFVRALPVEAAPCSIEIADMDAMVIGYIVGGNFAEQSRKLTVTMQAIVFT